MTREPSPKIRKLSSKMDTIIVDLTPEEIDAHRAKVCELLDEQDKLDRELETIRADFKGRKKKLDQAESVARRAIATKKQDQAESVARRAIATKKQEIEVKIEEILIDGLDGVVVQRVRADTGEFVGTPRKPTADEAQEGLPLSDSGFGA